MFVAINGGGEVGSFLARTLHGKGHTVTVIDQRAGDHAQARRGGLVATSS